MNDLKVDLIQKCSADELWNSSGKETWRIILDPSNTCDRIAIIKDPNFFQSFFYVLTNFYSKVNVIQNTGKSEVVLVNNNSFKKRVGQDIQSYLVSQISNKDPIVIRNNDQNSYPTNYISKPNENFDAGLSKNSGPSFNPSENRQPNFQIQASSQLINAQLIDNLVDLSKFANHDGEPQLTTQEAGAILEKASELAKDGKSRKLKRSNNDFRSRTIIVINNHIDVKCYLLFTRATSKDDKVLGQGSFKKVKYAVRLSFDPNIPHQLLVVGTIRHKEVKNKKSLKNEISLMERLKENGVSNVSVLESCLVTNSKYYLIMEYYKYKDLHFALYEKSDFILSEIDKYNLAADYSSGLAKLHEMGYRHRDIKPENFFINAKRQGVVGDLGLASIPSDQSRFCGTYIYLSPDLLNWKNLSIEQRILAIQKGDSWAFGFVLFEIFKNLNSNSCLFQIQNNFLESGDREKFKNEICNLSHAFINWELRKFISDSDVRQVISSLLQPDPTIRGDIVEAQKKLTEIRNKRKKGLSLHS